MARLEILPKRLDVLAANDPKSEFRINIDVLNEAFGVGRAMYAKACYPDKKGVSFPGTIPGDQFIIWMPKLYPNQSEWETSLQNDDSEIHEDAAQARHEDWIGIRKHDLSVLRLTFVKDTPKSPYRFMGVYRLTRMDHLHHTYERIATKVRLIGDPVDKVELLDDFR